MSTTLEEDLQTLKEYGITNLSLLASAASQFLQEYNQAFIVENNPPNSKELSFLKAAGAQTNESDFNTNITNQQLKNDMYEYSCLVASSFTPSQVSYMLDLPETKINELTENRTIYHIKTSQGRVYPRWQFTDNGALIPEIDSILKRLPKDAHPLEVSRFFNHPHSDLELSNINTSFSPLHWLMAGLPSTKIIDLLGDL